MACRMGNHVGAVSMAHAGISRKNVKHSYMRTFGTGSSYPEGFNNINAIDLPLDEVATVACVIYGDGSLATTAQSRENVAATVSGEGSFTAEVNEGVNVVVTVTGEGTLTPTVQNRENVIATLDAGSRPSAFDIAQELLGSSADGTMTVGQAFKIMLAALVGKVSGAGTSTITFRDVDDTKNRIVATVDGNGNRTSVTKDVS
jgi:carbon monoxide dehydrogenase subunit G